MLSTRAGATPLSPGPAQGRRRLRALAAAVRCALVLVATLALPGRALAPPGLTASTPAAGVRAGDSPHEIRLSFSETVTAGMSSLELPRGHGVLLHGTFAFQTAQAAPGPAAATAP